MYTVIRTELKHGHWPPPPIRSKFTNILRPLFKTPSSFNFRFDFNENHQQNSIVIFLSFTFTIYFWEVFCVVVKSHGFSVCFTSYNAWMLHSIYTYQSLAYPLFVTNLLTFNACFVFLGKNKDKKFEWMNDIVINVVFVHINLFHSV